MGCDPTEFVNVAGLQLQCCGFKGQKPFDHCVIDGFFNVDLAESLVTEFPAFESDCWFTYRNPLEIKRACNLWSAFGPSTYRAFSFLNSGDFVSLVSEALGIPDLSADPGLNGGGWHIHGRGGKLNPHLDYNLHPKLGLQRKLNIIVYLNPEWQTEWGGQLGLWEQDPARRCAGRLCRKIEPCFNRAILFDTTQDSWHGLAVPVATSSDVCRRSLAVYYLAPPPAQTEMRTKALFAPTADQEDDPAVIDLIRRRACAELAAGVWRTAS